MATNFSILAWRIPWGHKESDTTGRLKHTHTHNTYMNMLHNKCHAKES